MNGNLSVITYVSPSLNANGMDRPLGFAIGIDSQFESSYFIPPSAPGQLPAAWDGVDGFVANASIQVVNTFSGISPGMHTLKLSMIEPAVVVQKIVISCVFLGK